MLEILSLPSPEKSRFLASFLGSLLVCGATTSLVIIVFLSPELLAICDLLFWITTKSLFCSNHLLMLLSLLSYIYIEVKLGQLVDPWHEKSDSLNWFFSSCIYNIVSSRKLANSVSVCIASNLSFISTSRCLRFSLSYLSLSLSLSLSLFRSPSAIAAHKTLPVPQVGDARWGVKTESPPALDCWYFEGLLVANFIAGNRTLVDGFGSWITSGVAPYAEEPCPSLLISSHGVALLRLFNNVNLWSSFSTAFFFRLLGSASAFDENSWVFRTPAIFIVLSALEISGLEFLSRNSGSKCLIH